MASQGFHRIDSDYPQTSIPAALQYGFSSGSHSYGFVYKFVTSAYAV